MVIAPVNSVRGEITNSKGQLTKERADVVDDTSDIARALVNWVSWSHWRWTHSPAAGHCADCVHHQSGVRA